MKTVNIKGKAYVEVSERVSYFRSDDAFKGCRLLSEIIEISAERVLMRAWVENENGYTIAVGHAYEDANSSYINKTSYVENCETSAWGRALANMGIGIDASIASSLEVGNAVANQAEVETYQDNKAQPKNEKPWLKPEQVAGVVSYAVDNNLSGPEAVRYARTIYAVNKKLAGEIEAGVI